MMKWPMLGGEGAVRSRLNFVGGADRAALIWSYWRGDQAVSSVLDRVEAELGTPAASVVVTGENAAVIMPNCRRAGITLDEDLVMHGLWCIWRRNRETG